MACSQSKSAGCGCGCGGTGACGGAAPADLPDNPTCGVNFHFGMMLGDAELRAEQGFHVGRARRHQRWLHGRGVLCGLDVTLDTADAARPILRVEPGAAVDAWGREIVLGTAQCVDLAAHLLRHAADPAYVFAADGSLVLDVCLRAAICLDSPVPAISPACNPDLSRGAQVEFARLCESARLTLAPRPVNGPAADAALAADEGKRFGALGEALRTALDAAGLESGAAVAGWVVDAPNAALRVEAALDAALRTLPCPTGDPNACFVLASVRVSRAVAAMDAVVSAPELLPAVRPPLLSTRALTALLEGALSRPPLVQSVEIDAAAQELRLHLATPIDVITAQDAVFRVSVREADGFHDRGATLVGTADLDRTVVLKLATPLGSGLVRIHLDTTGPAPLLGSDLRSLGRFENTFTFTHAAAA